MKVLFNYDNVIIVEVSDSSPINHSYRGRVAKVIKGDLYKVGERTEPSKHYCKELDDPNEILKNIL